MADGPQETHGAGYGEMISIGMAMAAPVAAGIWVDRQWGLLPWCTVSGAFLGFALGMVQIFQVNRRSQAKASDAAAKKLPGQLPEDTGQ